MRIPRATGAALFVTAVSALTVVGAHATTIGIDSFDNGSYAAGGSHNPSDPATLVGQGYNNWFGFDLSSLAGLHVDSATLSTAAGNGRYFSTDSSEIYGLFDYTGSVSSLVNGTGGVAAFNDLGSGDAYGQTTVNGAFGQAMPGLSIVLSAAAIDDLNAAIASSQTLFAIGGTLLSLSGSPWQNLFLASNILPAGHLSLQTSELSAVPLPAALPLFGTGMMGLSLIGWMRRRKTT